MVRTIVVPETKLAEMVQLVQMVTSVAMVEMAQVPLQEALVLVATVEMEAMES